MLEQLISQEAGWTRFSFEEIAENVSERVEPSPADAELYVGLGHLEAGSLKVRDWGSDVVLKGTKLRMRRGDILFARRNAYLKRVAIAPHDGLFSAHGLVLRARQDVILPEFLPYFMQTDVFMDRAISISVGSLSPTINWKALAKEEFLLPPIQQQARLVDVLSAQRMVTERIQKAEGALARTQRALVEDLLVNKHTEAPLVRVSQLLTEGPRNGKSPQVANSENGFQTVSISVVSSGVFNPEGCIKFVDIDPIDAAPFVVQKGDAFAVRGNGNRNLMGKVGLCTKTYGQLIYPDLLIRLRFDETIILKEFAVAQWNHPSVHARLASRAKSSNGIWKVNGQDIRAHTLKVPHIDDQREAVAVFSRFQSQALSMQKRRTQLLRFRKQLYDQAFGQV